MSILPQKKLRLKMPTQNKQPLQQKKKMRVAKKFVTLENYISLLQNQDELDQTEAKTLNQILEIHGFSKIYGKPKRVLVDAINCIEVLLNPFRSTISENISSASLTKEDIVNDLSILDWKECAVQTIESIVANTTSPPKCSTECPTEHHGLDKCFTTEEKKKRSYTKKKNKENKGSLESRLSTSEKEQKRRYMKKKDKEKRGLLESGFSASWGCKKSRYDSNEIDFSSVPLLESVAVAGDDEDQEDYDEEIDFLPLYNSMFLS